MDSCAITNQTLMALVEQLNWNAEAVEFGVGAVLVMWAIGLGVGLAVGLVRKMRV